MTLSNRMQAIGGMLLPLAIWLTGCATSTAEIEPQRGPVTDVVPAELEDRIEQIRRAPVAYLREVAENCRDLDQYTLTFTRHERRGLFRQMHGPETFKCWYRREPFSVRMKCTDENLKYDETVYVRGKHDDKLRFITRWWTPPLKPPPHVNVVDIQTPVKWGESKRAVTDFGLERMMERTLASVEDAGDDVIVAYEEPVRLHGDGPTVHHVHLEYPASRYPVPIQELYINVKTDLPAGTVLKLPNGDIDAAYFYLDLDPDVTLTDEDFRFEAERGDVAESPSGKQDTEDAREL